MASEEHGMCHGSDNIDLICDVCSQQNHTSTANSYCENCDEALCTTCDTVHRNLKVSRGHSLLTGDELLSISLENRVPVSIMTCEKHQMKIEFFCKSHERLCCERCVVKSHRHCDLPDINSCTKQYKVMELFDAARKELSNIEKSYSDFKGKRIENKVELEVSIEKCVSEVKKVQYAFNDLIGDLTKTMENKLAEIKNKVGKEIDDDISLSCNSMEKIHENATTLDKCRISQQQGAMFIGLKRAEGLIKEYNNVFKDIVNIPKKVNTQFIPDYMLINCLHKLVSLGTVGDTQDKDFVEPVLNVKTRDLKHHYVGCTYVQGIVFLPSGHVVIACAGDGLVLLSKNFNKLSGLSLTSTSVCGVSSTEVLVTNGDGINFVDVLPKLEDKSVISVGKTAIGIYYHDGEIYVSCRDEHTKNGEIQVMNRNGEVQRIFGVFKGNYMFSFPFDVKVNNGGDRIVVTDKGNNTLTCLDQIGHVIYQYLDKDLVGIAGLYIDGQDNVLVCGSRSRNVHVVTKEGKKNRIILTEKEGLRRHICMSIRSNDGCLALGMNNDEGMSLVTVKIEVPSYIHPE